MRSHLLISSVCDVNEMAERADCFCFVLCNLRTIARVGIGLSHMHIAHICVELNHPRFCWNAAQCAATALLDRALPLCRSVFKLSNFTSGWVGTCKFIV